MTASLDHYRSALIPFGLLFVIFHISLLLVFGQSIEPRQAPTSAPPSVYRDTLSNGLQLISIEDSDLPRVYWTIQFQSPVHLEKDRAGVARLTAEVLGSGSDSINGFSTQDLLRKYDATLHTSTEYLSVSSPKEFAQETLEILAQLLLAPSFEEEAVTAAIQAYRNQIKSNRNNLKIRVQELGRQQMFSKNHPYGERITLASLDSIHRVDLIQHHIQMYRPQYAGIAVHGPLSAQEAVRWVTEALGTWTPREIPPKRHNRPNKVVRNRICFTDVPGETAMALTLSHTVRIQPGHKDEAACIVLNALITDTALPGTIKNSDCSSADCLYHGTSELRSDRILGHFQISALAEPHNLISYVENCTKRMEYLTLESVDDATLQKAKSRVISEIADELKPAQKTSNAWLHSVLDRNHLTDPESIISSISSVQPVDIQRVAINYLRPSNLILSIAGDRQLISDDFIVWNGGEAIQFYDFSGNSVLQLEPVKEGITAESIFESFYNACGGTDSFNALESIVKKGTMDTGTGMELDVKITSKFGVGYQMLVSKNDERMMEQTLTAEAGINRQMGRSTPMSDKNFQRLKKNLFGARFLHLAEEGLTARLLGLDRNPSGPYFVIELLSDDRPVETLYFHSTDDLLIKSISNRNGITGPVEVITTFSDYETSNDLSFPMTIVQITNGERMTFRLNKIIVNSRIPSALFELK